MSLSHVAQGVNDLEKEEINKRLILPPLVHGHQAVTDEQQF